MLIFNILLKNNNAVRFQPLFVVSVPKRRKNNIDEAERVKEQIIIIFHQQNIMLSNLQKCSNA